jgi:hypothetical protein
MRVPSRPANIAVMAALALPLAILILAAGAPGANAQRSPEQELVERFAPIVMLREQASDCDKSGEGYFPATVDFLFNNPDIRLMANAGGDKKNDVVLQEGLTPQELAAAGPDTYLDFPGNPRNPGCTYEQYFKRMVADLGLEPTTYARIVVDPAARRLYIEYWFYYYFNDWNNTHESDWEMLLIMFEGTTSVEEALERTPTSVGFAQHGGGETSSWTDAKLLKDGERIVAFPSAGSHATYYSQHNFIGWGENGTAFGCDNTTPPSVETPLNVVLVPEVIDPDSDLAFFLYEGHWGEREVAVYEGPKGPNLGGKWNDPTGAIENWRTSTMKVPDSSTIGGVNTTDFFCTLSEYGSKAVTYLGAHPWAVAALLVGILGALGLLCYWIWPYLLEAIDIYGNELRTFLGIGILVIPLGILGSLVSEYLYDIPPFEWIDQAFNSSTSGRTALMLVVGSLTQLVMVLLVTPAAVFAMKDIRQGITPGAWRSYRSAVRALGLTFPIVAVFAIAAFLMAFTLVLLPVAAYVLIRWLFSFHAGILDDQRPFLQALGASWQVTRRKWFKVFFGSLIYQLLVLVPGPLLGVIVLIVGGSRVGFANFLSSFVYALTIPLATIGITMLYHRMAGHRIVEPKMLTRELDEAKAAGRAKRDWVAETGD